MFENFFKPVEAWIIFLLFGLLAYQLNRKADKAGTQFKKDNLKTLLSKRVFKYPKQTKFDLSLYADQSRFSEKLLEAKNENGIITQKVWKGFSYSEKEGFILSEFEYIQQFLNCVNAHFVVELTNQVHDTLGAYDGPQTAICLKIMRGNEKIGKIEISANLLEDLPTAVVKCKLNFPDMFDYEEVYGLFIKIASVHFDDKCPSTKTDLNAQIHHELIKYTWNRMNSGAEAKYDGIDWHEAEALQMTFEGNFQKISQFKNMVQQYGDDFDVFKREIDSIKWVMEHYGYEEIT